MTRGRQDATSACHDGGGSADHTWIILLGSMVQCRDCPERLPLERLLEVYVEYDRIVQTGIAILQNELDQHRADLEAAAGELMVSIDDMPPGSKMRQIVKANVLIRQGCDLYRKRADGHKQHIMEALAMLRDVPVRGPHVALIGRLNMIREVLENAIMRDA